MVVSLSYFLIKIDVGQRNPGDTPRPVALFMHLEVEGYPTMISLTSPLLQLQGLHALFMTLSCGG